MAEGPPEVKAPWMKRSADTEDWRQHLYNQERMLSTQDEIHTVLESLLANQRQMAALASKLDGHIDMLGTTMSESSKVTAGLVAGVIKVPIAMAVVAAASWAFLYENRIGERTWLIMLAVAVFPWLGDSISAIAKLFGFGKHAIAANNGKRS
jgi:hypothetical protein